MKLTITSMSGTEHKMDLPDKESVLYFIDMYQQNLKKNHRVKITCDILGIDGYLQGKQPLRNQGIFFLIQKTCSLYFYNLFFYFMHHTLLKKIQ